MATRKANMTANDLQTLFDPKRFEGVYRAWAQTNERMIAVAVETGLRSNELNSATTKEALTNLRAAATVRDDVAEYGKAQAELVQKQTELFTRSAKAFGELMRSAGSETSAVATEAGETFKTVAGDVQSAANKATAAPRKAA